MYNKKILLNILTQQIKNKLTFNQFIQLFNNGIIIEQINHKLNIPNELIELIDINLKEQFITKIEKETINEFFNNNFKHLEDIYVINLDFNNTKQFQNFVFMFTNIQNLTTEQKYALNFIKLKLQGTNGFFTNFNKLINANLMIFNKNTYTKQTIRHECIHYLQTYQKYDLIKNIKIKDIDYNQFNYFPVKINHQIIINILFNKKQFSAILDNLISYLNIIYQKYYKDKINLRDFINQFIQYISNKTIFSSDIFQYWKKMNFSYKEIYFILYAKQINKHLYDKILLSLINIRSD